MATGSEFDRRDDRRDRSSDGRDIPDKDGTSGQRGRSPEPDPTHSTDELPRAGQQPTVQLPRGTGGQAATGRAPDPVPPQPTEQVRRPARDPRTRGGAASGARTGRPGRSAGSAGRPDSGYDAGADPRSEQTARPGPARPVARRPPSAGDPVLPGPGGSDPYDGPAPRDARRYPDDRSPDRRPRSSGRDAGYGDHPRADRPGRRPADSQRQDQQRGDDRYSDDGRYGDSRGYGGGGGYRDEPGHGDGRGYRHDDPPPRPDSRNTGYPDGSYRDSDYRDRDSPDRGYRDGGYREAGDRNGSRGTVPRRDDAHPAGAYRDDDGYRDDGGYPSHSYRGDGYRSDDGYHNGSYDDSNGYGADPYGAPPVDPYGADRDPRRNLPAEIEPRRHLPAVPEHPDRRPAEREPSPGFGKPPRTGENRPSHLPPYVEPDHEPQPAGGPRKLTVTRVAALRSKELTNRGVQLFRRAASADGADRSGLTHLTYAVMANYAVDAALAVALANTLFFAAASAESTGKVLLYLLITVAPFAVIAPFIGPMLDKVQNGRRVALAITSFGRTLLAVIMAFNFDSWILYPCALGMMVLSKSFGVLKAALTPRVLPEQITLVKTNSRLTVFGLIAGGVSGAFAAGFTAISNSSGALLWTAACGVAGGVLCLRIPAWVESTAGEVPVHHSEVLDRNGKRRLPTAVSATLWANIANRIETGFLALFIAFVVKTEYADVSGFGQLLLLGIVGAAAGIGGFVGNALGAKLPLGHPEKVAAFAVMGVAITTFIAILIPGLAMGAVVGLVGSTASSLAKVCLDSVLQHELPEASRASAFGMSESALQLAWVGGGVVGLLLGGVLHISGDGGYMLGFGVVTVLVVVGLVQSWLRRSGRSMFPEIGTRFGRSRNRAVPAGAAPGRRGGRSGAAGEYPGGPGAGGAPGGPGGPPTLRYDDQGAAGRSGGKRTKRVRRAGDPR